MSERPRGSQCNYFKCKYAEPQVLEIEELLTELRKYCTYPEFGEPLECRISFAFTQPNNQTSRMGHFLEVAFIWEGKPTLNQKRE